MRVAAIARAGAKNRRPRASHVAGRPGPSFATVAAARPPRPPRAKTALGYGVPLSGAGVMQVAFSREVSGGGSATGPLVVLARGGFPSARAEPPTSARWPVRPSKRIAMPCSGAMS